MCYVSSMFYALLLINTHAPRELLRGKGEAQEETEGQRCRRANDQGNKRVYEAGGRRPVGCTGTHNNQSDAGVWQRVCANVCCIDSIKRL